MYDRGRHRRARWDRPTICPYWSDPQFDRTRGALVLVVNVVVLWNTIYMDAALAQLLAEGVQVHDANVGRLSPLGFAHINMLGRDAFTLPDIAARGELRPLRDPALHDNEGCN